jgi:hypothetical protein
VREQDSAAANKVILMSESVRKMAEELIAQLAGGLQAGDTETLTTLRLQTSFVDSLRHIFTLTRRVSRTVLAQPL